jgi:hypothetical protein
MRNLSGPSGIQPQHSESTEIETIPGTPVKPRPKCLQNTWNPTGNSQHTET